MNEVETEHRISWWVWAGDQKIRRAATMRGTWGYDVTCSCGWETRTGGATLRYIRDEVWHHKRDYSH
jgi:hypothetical protein